MRRHSCLRSDALGAEYAFSYWDDMLQYDILDGFLTGEVDLDAVVRGEVLGGGEPDEDDHPFTLDVWAFDYGRSV